MKSLIEMLTAANVLQVTNWELFQNTPNRRYFIGRDENSTLTHVWVKWDDTYTKYSFDIMGILVNVTNETPE